MPVFSQIEIRIQANPDKRWTCYIDIIIIFIMKMLWSYVESLDLFTEHFLQYDLLLFTNKW